MSPTAQGLLSERSTDLDPSEISADRDDQALIPDSWVDRVSSQNRIPYSFSAAPSMFLKPSRL